MVFSLVPGASDAVFVAGAGQRLLPLRARIAVLVEAHAEAPPPLLQGRARLPPAEAPVIADLPPTPRAEAAEGIVAVGVAGPTGAGRVIRLAAHRPMAGGLGHARPFKVDELLATQTDRLVARAIGRGVVARRQALTHSCLVLEAEASLGAALVGHGAGAATRGLRRSHGFECRPRPLSSTRVVLRRGETRQGQQQREDQECLGWTSKRTVAHKLPPTLRLPG